MTNGDVKSVQGDTGHAEAEMVTDVYSEIIDEDRRFNAQKMDKEFYSTLNDDTDIQKQDTGFLFCPAALCSRAFLRFGLYSASYRNFSNFFSFKVAKLRFP